MQIAALIRNNWNGINSLHVYHAVRTIGICPIQVVRTDLKRDTIKIQGSVRTFISSYSDCFTVTTYGNYGTT